MKVIELFEDKKKGVFVPLNEVNKSCLWYRCNKHNYFIAFIILILLITTITLELNIKKKVQHYLH
jgi:hypothetical protein